MANLIMRFPGGKGKTVTLSYDDGVEQDIKLIEIVKKYGVRGTFNLNSGCYPPEDITWAPGTIHRRMPKSRVTEVYTNCDWEVATHGYTHPSLVGLPVNIATQEIVDDRKALEEQFGGMIRGFAYPFGAYDDTAVEVLRSCGICYARTVGTTHDFNIPKDWLRLDATCHHNDPMLMELAQRFLDIPANWDPKMFYLWGHSYEFEEKDNWDVLENFCKLIGGREDIWYATNIEIYDYWYAFKQLRFNMAMNECYNPTAMDIWFCYGDKELVIKGGETIKF